MLGTAGPASAHAQAAARALDREVEQLARAVAEHGAHVSRAELEGMLGARAWGPGRYRAAMRCAVRERRVVRIGRRGYAPPPPRDGA
jgi:uncharacterized protein YcaQ